MNSRIGHLGAVITLAGVTLLAAPSSEAELVAAAPAAAVTHTFDGWRFAPGRICLEDHGWSRWPTASAARKVNATDVWMVNWDNCSSQPRTMTITVKVYSEAGGGCAKTTPGVINGATHTPRGQVVIWMNVSPHLASRCHGTAAKREHLLVHELLHAVGLGHRPAGARSVVAADATGWQYTGLQSMDTWAVNDLY